jgi:hypothetical protein
MTGIQALERAAAGLPMRPGQVERREFEYRRHGTQTLIAGFDVTTGKVGGVVGNTRTEVLCCWKVFPVHPPIEPQFVMGHR